MARKEASTTTEVSDKAAATRAAIGTRPRQGQKRLVEYFAIVSTLAPERIEELFGAERAEQLAAHVDDVKNPVIEFRAKSDANQLDMAVRALTNTDPLNGYANFAFDEKELAEKLREKTARGPKQSITESFKAKADSATPEELAELAALLAARGVQVPTE